MHEGDETALHSSRKPAHAVQHSSCGRHRPGRETPTGTAHAQTVQCNAFKIGWVSQVLLSNS